MVLERCSVGVLSPWSARRRRIPHSAGVSLRYRKGGWIVRHSCLILRLTISSPHHCPLMGQWDICLPSCSRWPWSRCSNSSISGTGGRQWPWEPQTHNRSRPSAQPFSACRDGPPRCTKPGAAPRPNEILITSEQSSQTLMMRRRPRRASPTHLPPTGN